MQHCPSRVDGPLEWTMSRCVIDIPDNTTQVRMILNAGWSSQPDKLAITWLDALSLHRIDNDRSYLQNSEEIKTLIKNNNFTGPSPNSLVQEYTKINPTLWKVKVHTSTPFTLAFAESFDPRWQAKIFKNGGEVEIADSTVMHGAINSFDVNQTGDLDITIRYTQQNGYEIGLIISGQLSCLLCSTSCMKIEKIKIWQRFARGLDNRDFLCFNDCNPKSWCSHNRWLSITPMFIVLIRLRY